MAIVERGRAVDALSAMIRVTEWAPTSGKDSRHPSCSAAFRQSLRHGDAQELAGRQPPGG